MFFWDFWALFPPLFLQSKRVSFALGRGLLLLKFFSQSITLPDLSFISSNTEKAFLLFEQTAHTSPKHTFCLDKLRHGKK